MLLPIQFYPFWNIDSEQIVFHDGPTNQKETEAQRYSTAEENSVNLALLSVFVWWTVNSSNRVSLVAKNKLDNFNLCTVFAWKFLHDVFELKSHSTIWNVTSFVRLFQLEYDYFNDHILKDNEISYSEL